MLIKDKGCISLNGVKRAMEIFGPESRIAPDTVWKASELMIVEGTDFCHAINPNGNAFKISGNIPVFALTMEGVEGIFIAGRNGICKCAYESGQAFSVEWTYRVARNIILSEIAIRMAQYDLNLAREKRYIQLLKDGKPIRDRVTSESAISFYQLGAGLASRLKIVMAGYLREVAMRDTERGQK